MLSLFAGGPGPSWSSQGFITQGSGSSSNHANQVQPATAPDPVQPAGSSTKPCRFRFPDSVFEQTGPSPVRPFDFDALFVKWSINYGVADAYIKRYISKHNSVPSEESKVERPELASTSSDEDGEIRRRAPELAAIAE
jgi:hypothetical protein